MIYVKTVYAKKYGRAPNISEYKTEKEAKVFIKICLQWSIGIISCRINRTTKDNLP